MAFYAALIHYPVYNRNKQTVTTATTNLDIHDIARCAATYGVKGYYLVQPDKEQQKIVQETLHFWQEGLGAAYNADRAQAFSIVHLAISLADVLQELYVQNGRMPKMVYSSAKSPAGKMLSYQALREKLQADEEDYVLLLGTGWGLTEEIYQKAEYCLPPIVGSGSYNHLSVRAAAAIIFDRLLAP